MIMDILIWLGFLLALALSGWSFEDDHWFFGGLVQLAMICVAIYYANVFSLLWIKANWMLVLQILGIYLATGIVWSFIKFYNKFSELKISQLVLGTRSEKKWITDEAFKDVFSKVPFWIAFWPNSLLWSFVSDFMRSFFK